MLVGGLQGDRTGCRIEGRYSSRKYYLRRSLSRSDSSLIAGSRGIAVKVFILDRLRG